jgi:uncharacterized protein (DUF1501 family)
MEELRGALMAFLAAVEQSDVDWKQLHGRLRLALETDAAPQQLDGLISEYTAEVTRLGHIKLLTPLYPFGVLHWVQAKRDTQRYKELAHVGRCNCEVVSRERLFDHLDSQQFVMVAESDDFYDRYKEYRCPTCQATWRLVANMERTKRTLGSGVLDRTV